LAVSDRPVKEEEEEEEKNEDQSEAKRRDATSMQASVDCKRRRVNDTTRNKNI